MRTFAPREDERAMAAIRRAKGYGGLAGFGLTALASYMHGELIATSLLLRALARRRGRLPRRLARSRHRVAAHHPGRAPL